jgi:K(+)-stimulated pyrophosphate-energized sodium pump
MVRQKQPGKYGIPNSNLINFLNSLTMLTPIFWIVPAASLVALFFAFFFYKQMMKADEGTDKMRSIAQYVREGAMSYLKQQYKVVAIVFLCMVAVFSIMAYGFDLQNPWVPVAFLTGGFFSAFSGYLGMRTATNASAVQPMLPLNHSMPV